MTNLFRRAVFSTEKLSSDEDDRGLGMSGNCHDLIRLQMSSTDSSPRLEGRELYSRLELEGFDLKVTTDCDSTVLDFRITAAR